MVKARLCQSFGNGGVIPIEQEETHTSASIKFPRLLSGVSIHCPPRQGLRTSESEEQGERKIKLQYIVIDPGSLLIPRASRLEAVLAVRTTGQSDLRAQHLVLCS